MVFYDVCGDFMVICSVLCCFIVALLWFDEHVHDFVNAMLMGFSGILEEIHGF